MKINEITAGQINELDVRTGLANLAKGAARGVAKGAAYLAKGGYASVKNVVNPDDVTDADVEPYRPQNNQTEYYNDKTFYFDKPSGKWINTETEKSAWPATQEALMNKYGFRSRGTPTRALRRKIYQKKKRDAQKNTDKKVFSFPKEDVQQIQQAFQKSRAEYDSTGRLDRFFRNADAMLQYTDKGFDITKLQNAVRPSFLVVSTTTAFTFLNTTVKSIFDATFVTPDKTKLNQARDAYKTSTGSAPGGPPTGFKDIPAAGLNNIKQTIVMVIRSLNTAEAKTLYKEIRDLDYKNYKTDDIKLTVISEIERLLTNATTRRKKISSAQLDALLDMIIYLKPVLQPKAADINAKVAALNFSALIPDLTDSDELILTQKRNKAKIV
jgi:hypothetical protein